MSCDITADLISVYIDTNHSIRLADLFRHLPFLKLVVHIMYILRVYIVVDLRIVRYGFVVLDMVSWRFDEFTIKVNLHVARVDQKCNTFSISGIEGYPNFDLNHLHATLQKKYTDGW